MALVDRTPNWFAFLVRRDCVGVQAFFCHNPVTYERDGELNGALFCDSGDLPTEAEVDGLFREYYMLGLAGLTLFRFDPSGSKSGGLVLRPVAQIDSAGMLHAQRCANEEVEQALLGPSEVVGCTRSLSAF
jgi:hypothetical protein